MHHVCHAGAANVVFDAKGQMLQVYVRVLVEAD